MFLYVLFFVIEIYTAFDNKYDYFYQLHFETSQGAMVQSVIGNLLEISSTIWIEIFKRVNYFVPIN